MEQQSARNFSAILLGSGGWIPTSARATCSALVRDGGSAVLLDAGTGAARIVEHPELLDGVREISVVLTHFHLDHVVGLSYLPELSVPEPPVVYAPGAWLYGVSSREILERLIGPPLFAVELGAIVSRIEEISPQGLTIGPIAIHARRQDRHSDPTLGLRVGDVLTYCTDTAFDESTVDFARGSRFLAHEAWYTEDAPREESTHSSAREAATVASDAGVERLTLIHIRPGADEPHLLAEAQSVFPRAVVGSDLLGLTEDDAGG